MEAKILSPRADAINPRGAFCAVHVPCPTTTPSVDLLCKQLPMVDSSCRLRPRGAAGHSCRKHKQGATPISGDGGSLLVTETRPRRRLRGSWWSIPLILAAAIWASALDFSTIRAWSDLMNSTHSSTTVYIDATSWNELKGSNKDRMPSFGSSCLANAIVAN